MTLKRNLDRWLWFGLSLLPVLAWVVLSWRNASATDILPYLNAYSFPWLQNIFDAFFALFDGYQFPLSGYLSYLVALQLAKCAYIVVTFLVEWAQSLSDVFLKKVGG